MSTATQTPTPETHTYEFKAETKQLLDLMIHSLYTNKDIFLRELISNASDALDRLRFEALTNPELMGDEKLEIRMESDKPTRTLTISDNGIGMSREEVISNIGTIAKSGTRELVERIKSSDSPETAARLIGQFGVGFYSAFMAADRVVLVTRRAGEQTATRWESTGDGSYTLEDAERPTRGTSITLYLKPSDSEKGIDDWTEYYPVSKVVKQYSDFVSYPIIFKDEREEMEKDENGMPKKDGKSETVITYKTLNSMKPIWTRPADEVKEEEYKEFYKHISHDWSDPMKHFAFKAEGRIEYQALLFFPSTAPYDLYYVAYEYGLQLYVRRVMIMDKCQDLLPHYLRFVKGVVDSADLPLNISRQRLQEDRHITQIRRWLTKKILDALAELKEQEPENYLQFWKEFGRAIKEGVSADYDNKDKILELLLFQSSNDPEKLTTLKEYVERMKPEQKQIFYLTGESRAQVENSPHLEAFTEKGLEVLFFVDPVDELMTQTFTEYDGKRLKPIARGSVELGSKEEREESKKVLEEKEKEHKDLLEALQTKLDEWVKQVRLTNRLTTSPVCLVGADHDYSPQLEKLLQKGKGGGPKQRRILEVNPNHPILLGLQKVYEKDKNDSAIEDYAQVLFGYGLLSEGSDLEDPVRFNKALADLMSRSLSIAA